MDILSWIAIAVAFITLLVLLIFLFSLVALRRANRAILEQERGDSR